MRTVWNKGKKLHYDVWNKGKTKKEDSRIKGGCPKGTLAWNKGKTLSELHKLHLHKKHKCLSEDTKRKMRGRRPWNKIGDGNTSVNEKFRHSIDYKIWRTQIYERDNWTCQTCNKRGGELHAHHIKSFSLYPDLRLDINNGVTLCKDCHELTDTYGLNQYTISNKIAKNTNAA